MSLYQRLIYNSFPCKRRLTFFCREVRKMEGASNSSSRSKKKNPQMKLSDKGQAVAQDQTDASSPKGDTTVRSEDHVTQIVDTLQAETPTNGCKSKDEYVQLVIKGHTPIPMSKQSLRDASPYFATLLKSNQEIIHMTPPATLRMDCYLAVLHSVSTSVQPKVDESNMGDFFVLSRRFLMKQLEETCNKVIRKALPTLMMDALCRLWRIAHAEHCDDVKKWFLAGIVRSLDQASHSLEFMNLEFEELVAVLSDDEFLPLIEEDVCKAIIGWCEHDAQQRMTPKHLCKLLAEVVWDRFDNGTIRRLTASIPALLLRSIWDDIVIRIKVRKMPQRAVERHLIFGHEAFEQLEQGSGGKHPTRELLHFDCHLGTLRVWNAPTARTLCSKGTWRYLTHDLNVGHPSVIFLKKSDSRDRPVDVIAIVNLVNGYARLIENGLSGQNSMEVVMGGYDVILDWCYRKFHGFLRFNSGSWAWEGKPGPFKCEELKRVSSCSLQLAGCEKKLIVHLLSFIRREKSGKLTPDSIIGFHDKNKDLCSAFERLPSLPTPRQGSAIVQCGTFLFVTGGSDMTDDNVALAKQCYRLDLTTRDRWERIGDLSGPRVDHCVFVQCGRVFVYGGSTLNKKKQKVALMSFETYDLYADVWTVFTIPLTSADQETVGSFGDTEQTTYCVDLGGCLDETKYRDIDDPIY